MMRINKNILIVVRWPLGGIRTYMRYMFSHFPSDFKLTIVAASTQEDQAFIHDTETYHAQLVLVQVKSGTDFTKAIFMELLHGRHDLIISQGFVSAVSAHFANFLARVPHMVTIHGIVEPHYLTGRFSVLKRWMLKKVLAGATVLYGVSHDILGHVYSEFPTLKGDKPRSLVIPNGIEPSDFDTMPEKPFNLRETLRIPDEVFLFGFFGRFMPQKGFDLIIEAVDLLRQKQPDKKFAIVAVGAGDYIREYQISICKKQLEPFFFFLPFQPMVHHLYPQVNTILMPSRWEASGLLAMEALCAGTPLIASDCIGLRETIADTPTYVFQSQMLDKLVAAIEVCVLHCDKDSFDEYVPKARERFNISHSAKQLTDFISKLLDKNE